MKTMNLLQWLTPENSYFSYIVLQTKYPSLKIHKNASLHPLESSSFTYIFRFPPTLIKIKEIKLCSWKSFSLFMYWRKNDVSNYQLKVMLCFYSKKKGFATLQQDEIYPILLLHNIVKKLTFLNE